MGNLIKDFWTYQYKGREYYGVVEIVGGIVEQNRSSIEKKETRIEKALAYMLTPGLRFLSHMGMQSYNEYLNKSGRSKRDDNEESFYPMFFELEPPKDAVGEYQLMVYEAYKLVTYLIYEKGINERDILILLNNSRSLYVMINPVIYGLRPGSNLHKVYREIYKELDEILDFQYIDENMYRYNGLMKTPNCWYKGGFFVPITYDELRSLKNNPELKKELTKDKRSLDYNVPGEASPAFTDLYNRAKERVLKQAKENKSSGRALPGAPDWVKAEEPSGNNLSYIRKLPKCIEYILNNKLDKGIRNSALVTVAIHFRNQGQSQKQVEDLLLELADKWDHDETTEVVKAIAKSVFHNKTNFSCKDGARIRLKLKEGFCKDCPLAKGSRSQDKNYTRFKIHRSIINELWENKASLRHYIAYLELSRNNLYNRWFSLETVNSTERTIRELCNKSNNLIFSQNGDSVMVYNKLESKESRDAVYNLIPNEFYDNRVYEQMDHHLKHFLRLIFTGYKLSKEGTYIKARVGKKRIMELLGYKTEDAVYKLFQKLNGLGLTVFNNGKLFAVYYESYKVIDIEEYREAEKPAASLQGARVAGGELLVICNKYTEDRGSPDTG